MRLFILISFIISGTLFACQDTKTSSKNIVTEAQNTPITEPTKVISEKIIPEKVTNANVIEFLTEYGKQNPERFVRIHTKYGDIDLELFNETPLHRANFIHIIKRGFLSETCFYRVAKGFVIQGGNSDSFKMARIKNSIGAGYTVPSEFKPNLKHRYGSLGMARSWKNNPNRRSSGFEFYIVVNPKGSPHIDKEHTVFGKVIKGMDVAEKISLEEVDFSEWPKKDVPMDVSILR